ncbi:STAS domain-containing protein [Amycolatopsis australiensis]|uniref:Anti-sigma factor antagonist n=1 Tax=Amycolatopsis australiensis TaxID=546364 RepID=A0A1K1QYQ1_9PSEU|nr:STAS domain-containing protein [Amycolatopsis australiensis]SFW65000.1 anti-anti-sigma factor [Amycolatopsis australiensis]
MRQWPVGCRGATEIAITVRQIDDSAVVVAVRGEIDSTNAEALSGALSAALPGTARMIVDFGEVTFCGSSGLRVLVLAREACAARGTGFLVLPSPVVRRAVTMCELDRVLPLASEDETVTTRLTGHS